MQKEIAALVNKQLDKIDRMMALPTSGEVLYQILSGSVRGPDTGAGKSQSTMRLRRRCFPRTCGANTTGMMNSEGEPELIAGAGAGTAAGHFHGHANSAITYLQQIDRKAHNARPVAAKSDVSPKATQ